MYRWTGWNEANTAELRTRWLAGESGELIAEHLGAPSRSAVIGKAWRMGLAERATYQRKPYAPRPKRQSPRIKPKATSSPLSFLREAPTDLPPADVADIPRVSLMDLENHHCRWVCADHSNNETAQYCGAQKMTGLPYCENHARRAYAAAQPATSAKSYRQLAVKGSRLAVGKVFAF